MKIAILSDTHDNVANAKSAVQQVRKLGAEALFFCGDFCSPGAGIALAEFPGPIYVVFGNNDGDKLHIVQYMEKGGHKNIKFFSEADGKFTIAGKKIAMTHYPFYAQALARTGDYDLVCFGHDHVGRIENYGNCLAVNPGTLNPNFFRPDSTLSFAIYDSETHTATLYTLDGKPL